MKSFGIIMPLMSVWFVFSILHPLQSIVTSNLFQIVQQFLLKRYLAPEVKEGETK